MIDLGTLAVGEELPPLSREGTLQHWNRFAGANDEFADHHMDDEVGRHEGFSGAFMMAPLEHAYYHVLLREWFGDNGRIVDVDMRLRSPLLRGRTFIAGASVKSIEREGDEVIVHLDLWANDDEGTRIAPGSATVVLPAQ